MDLNEEHFFLDEEELPRRRQDRKLRYYMIAFTVAIISAYGAFFRGITWKNTSRDPAQEFNLSSNQLSVPFYEYNADDGADEVCKFLKNSTIPAEAAKLFFHNENVELPAHSAEAVLTKMMIAGWFALFLQVDAALEREGFKAPAFLYYDAVVTQLEDIKQFPTRRFTNQTACSTAYATLLTKIRPLPTNKMFEYFTVAEEVINLIKGKAVVLILGITKAGKSLLSHILGESPILQFMNHLGNVVYFPNMSAVTNPGLLNVSVGTGMQSTTKYINAFQLKDYVQWFLDFAGFLDGRSADQDIANGQVGVEVLLKAKEISPVLVINGASMIYSFTNIASILVQLFPNLEEDSKSFIYIFNRINDCKMCNNSSMYQSYIHDYFSERRNFLGTSELTNPGFLSLLDDIIEKTRCDGEGWKYAIYLDVEYKDLGREQILGAISKIPPIQVSSNRVHHFIGENPKASLDAEQNVQLHSMSHMMQFPFNLSTQDIQMLSYRLNVLRKLAENLTFDESKFAYIRGTSTIQNPINILKQNFKLSFANHFSTLNSPTDFTKLCKDFQSFITLNKQLTEKLKIHAKDLVLPSKEQLLLIIEENIRIELQKHLNKFNNLDELEKGIFNSIKILLDFSSIAARNIDGYATFHGGFIQKVENRLFSIAKYSKENNVEESKMYFEKAVESWDISRIVHSLDLMHWSCEALSTYFPSVQSAYSTSKSSFEVKFINYVKDAAGILKNSQKIDDITVKNISPILRALKSALFDNRLKAHFNEYLTDIYQAILLGAVTEFSKNNSVLLNATIHRDQESKLVQSVQSLYNNSKILSTTLSSLFADELIKQSLSKAYRFDSDLVGNFAKRLELSIENLVHSLSNDSSETSVRTLERLFKTYDSCDWIKEIRPVEYQMIEDAIAKIITGYQSLKKGVTDFMLGISIPEQLTTIRIWTNNLQMAKIIFNTNISTSEPVIISSNRASPRSDILKSINETEKAIVEKRMKVLNGITSSISNLSVDFQSTLDFVKLMNLENSHSARQYLQDSIELRLYELSENSTRELHNQFISDYSTAIKNQIDFVFNIIKSYQDGTAEKNETVLNNIGNLLKNRLDELDEYRTLTEFKELYSSFGKRFFDLKKELGKIDSGLLKSDISEYTTVFNISAALSPLDSHFLQQYGTTFNQLKEKSRTNFDSANSDLATSIATAIKTKKIREVNDLLVKSKNSGIEEVYKRHCNHLIEYFDEELLLLEKFVDKETISSMEDNEISKQIVSLDINMQITQHHISEMTWSQFGTVFGRIFTKIRGKVQSFSNIERPLSSRQYSLIDQTLKKLKNMHDSLQNAKEAFAKYVGTNESILDFLKEKIEAITSQTLIKLNQNIEYFHDIEFDRWIYKSKEVYDQIKESDYFSEFLSYIEGNVTETVRRRISYTLNNTKTTADQKIQELESLKPVVKNDFPETISNNCDKILWNEVKRLSDDKSDLENSLESNWKIIEENLKLNMAYETKSDREKTIIDELTKIHKINPSKFSTYCQNIIEKCELSSQKILNSLRNTDDLHSFIYSIHFFDRFHLHNFALLDERFKIRYSNFISQTRDIIKEILKWNNSQFSPVSKELKKYYYGYDFLSQINYHFPTSYQLIEDENFKNFTSNLKNKLIPFSENKKSMLQSALNNFDAKGVFEIFQYLKNNNEILKKFISLSASSSSSTDFLLEGFEKIYLLDHAKEMLFQSIKSSNDVLSQNINDLRSSTNNHVMRRGLMEDIEKRLSFYRNLSEIFLSEVKPIKGDKIDESESESGSHDESGYCNYNFLTDYKRFLETFKKDIVDPSVLEIKYLMNKFQQKNNFIDHNGDVNHNSNEELLSLVEKEKFDQNYDHILLIQKLFGTSSTSSSSELFPEISKLIEENNIFFNDKIDQIAKDFTDKQDAMNKLRAAGGTLELQKYIEQLVKYLIQFDDIRQLHSTFHDRIDQKIKELLDTKSNPSLREEDIFDIGTVLAQSPNGFDIAKRESTLFDASWNVLRKKDTEAMDLPRALDFLSEHASSSNTQRLQIFYKNYEKRYREIVESARNSIEKENYNNDKEKISQYIKKKIIPEFTRIKRKVKISQNKREKFVFWDPQTKESAIEMIPYMMAINTLRSSRLTWQPHVIQVLSMLIIFGADKENSSLFSRWVRGDVPVLMNHLLQILTGQGKSIILSSTAAIFAELGYDVYISCYSRYLSDRDKMQFQDFFKLLEIDANQHVVYNTLHNLVERMINNEGNFRDQIIRSIKGQELINIANVTSNSNHNDRSKILLLDEVDILLTPSFFVDPYNLSVPLKHSSISDLMEFIWKEGKSKGSSQVSLLDIKSSEPYQSCISTFPRWKFLFEIAIEEMLLGMKNVMTGNYHDAVLDEATKTFGYKLNDEISYKFNYGYETLFLYFKQAEGYLSFNSNVKLTFQEAKEKSYISVNGGSFLYRELVKEFHGIFGVTGSLESLLPEQLTALRTLLSVPEESGITSIPSAYENREKRFCFNPEKNPKDFQIIPQLEDYYKAILDEIFNRSSALRPPFCSQDEEDNISDANEMDPRWNDRKDLKRPVLIFVNSQEELFKLHHHTKDQLTKAGFLINIMLENDDFDERDKKIRNAVKPGTITFAVEVYGRGTDFVHRNNDLNAIGGIHVLQVFFSSDFSHQIQTMGRTARDNNIGSYSLVVFHDDLVNNFKLSNDSVSELMTSPQPEQYQKLFDFRTQFVGNQFQQYDKLRLNKIDMHEKAVRLLSYNEQEIMDYLTSCILRTKSVRTNYFFVLDRSGSMENEKEKAVKKCMHYFYSQVINQYDEIGIVVFDNIWLPTHLPLIVNNEKNHPVIAKSLQSLPSARGMTNLRDAVQHGYKEFTAHLAKESANPSITANVDNWIIILTDGGDSGSAVSHSEILQTIGKNPNIGIVLFGIGCTDKEEKVLKEMRDAGPVGRRHYFSGTGDEAGIQQVFNKMTEALQIRGEFAG
eukprot:gene6738-7261_t